MFSRETKSEVPTGVQMMVKALFPGFDPNDFSAKIQEVSNGTARTVADFQGRLTRLESKVDQIILLLSADKQQGPGQLARLESNGSD